MRKLVIAAKAEQPKPSDIPPTPMEMDDGRVINWYRPDPRAMILMLSAAEDAGFQEGGQVRSAKSAIDTGVSMLSLIQGMLLDDGDWDYLIRRIRSHNDPLTMDIMMDEITAMMREEWTDRPSEPSSPSSSSPGRTGKRSTATSKPAASTRSRSASTSS